MIDVRRSQDLGYLDVIAPIVSGALIAGGSVGSALIQRDAYRYAASSQRKTDLARIAAEERMALAMEQGLTERETVRQSATTDQTRSAVGVLALLGLAAAAVMVR